MSLAPRTVTVRGATLAGMATAARLARLGHAVALHTEGAPLGQRWAAQPGPGGHLVGSMPPVITLPASWRDLFKKTGAHLVVDLNRAGLELLPAPTVEHRLPDGSILDLPTNRAHQCRAISHTFGRTASDRWAAMLDDLDELWRAFRASAIDGTERPRTPADQKALWLDRTLADVADRVGPLAPIVLSLGSPRSPALLALPLTIDRVFDRWQLTDATGRPQRASLLIDLLAERLRVLGVNVTSHPLDGTPTVDCLPHQPPGGLLRRPVPPALRPTVTHRIEASDGRADLHEYIDHTGPAPLRVWRQPVDEGVLVTEFDHTRPIHDLDWGLGIRHASDWLRQPAIVGADGVVRASACSPAAGRTWGELASAALATYEVHRRLTGEDPSPSNKDFVPPHLRRDDDS